MFVDCNQRIAEGYSRRDIGKQFRIVAENHFVVFPDYIICGAGIKVLLCHFMKKKDFIIFVECKGNVVVDITDFFKVFLQVINLF